MQGGLPASGGMKPESFMKLCKKCGVKWAVFVRDPTHCWYQRGLQDGDKDGFNGVLSLLQVGSVPRIRQCPPRRRDSRPRRPSRVVC